MLTLEKNIQTLVKNADAILITAGAGMGVDSGLPDFRGNNGFWKAYPVIKKLGYSFVEMASPTWFDTNPELAWAFYGHRLNLYRETIPHDGFKMLFDLVKAKNENYFVFTSNVDGQFQKAGFSNEKIWEVHGSIHHFQCTQNCTKNVYKAPEEEILINIDKFQALNIPQCPNCNKVARPNILMFNDWSWNSKRSDTQERRYRKWIQKVRDTNEKLLIIEVGAGTAIPTVRDLSDRCSQELENAVLIRINLRESAVNLDKNISLSVTGLEGITLIANNALTSAPKFM